MLRQLRDYGQDLEAILVAKPARLTIEMTAMWQDHVGKVLLKGPSGNATEDSNAAVDEAEDRTNLEHVFVQRKRWQICGHGLFKNLLSMWSRICFIFDERQENLRNAEYNVVCANLSADYKDAVSYNLRKNKAGSRVWVSNGFSSQGAFSVVFYNRNTGRTKTQIEPCGRWIPQDMWRRWHVHH